MITKDDLVEGKRCFADARDHCDWCEWKSPNKKYPYGWGKCNKPSDRECPEDEETP